MKRKSEISGKKILNPSAIWNPVSISAIRHLASIAIVLFLASGFSIHGAFLDMGSGARPTALGSAYTALCDDSSGLLWNPAGPAQVRTIQATFMYSMPYMGLDFKAGEDNTGLGMNYGAALYPFKKWGTLGLGVSNLSVTDLYSENVYIISYSIPVPRIREFFNKFKSKSSIGAGLSGYSWGKKRIGPSKYRTYLGMNIKYLSHAYTLDDYTKDDPVFASGKSAGAVSIDLGILVSHSEKLFIGAALKDLNQPDVGLKDKDSVPMETRLGFAYKFSRITPLLDLSLRDKIFNAGAGAEYRTGILDLRVGGNMDEATAGFGLNIKFLSVDYSFAWPFGIKGSYGTHRMSLGILFSGPRAPDKKEIKTKVYSPEKAPAVKPKEPKEEVIEKTPRQEQEKEEPPADKEESPGYRNYRNYR